MAFVTLIDTEYLFKYTTIDKNTDPDLLNPAIIIAADTHIQQIIGYNMYQGIMDMVSDGSIDDVANIKYKTLLVNQIQPALAHFAVYEALPAIQYRLTNKAILSKTSENSTSTGLKELSYLRDATLKIANYYNQRIRETIINDPSSYQLYFQSVGIDRIVPKRTTYFNGWSGNTGGGYRRTSPGHGDPDCNGCEAQGHPLN